MEALLEHRMELAGHSTRALEIDGAGPGIVLLHGWGDSADVWRPLLAELVARHRRAVGVDLPGFGRGTPVSPRPPPGRSPCSTRPTAAPPRWRLALFTRSRPPSPLSSCAGGRAAGTLS